MTHSSQDLCEAIAALVEESTVRAFDKLYDQFEHAIFGLVQKRVVKLKPDHLLGGKGLEIRVRLILEDMGLIVRDGRTSTVEDWIVDFIFSLSFTKSRLSPLSYVLPQHD